jgi:uncharacterized protein YciI
MLYALIAFLKPGATPIPESVQVETTDFLGQPMIKIHSAGPLRDASGKRIGMMMVFEEETREAAEKLALESPYRKAGLFEDYHVYEFANEVG